MSLTFKGSKAVRFEHVDNDVESTVTLLADDDQETLVRKLKRIIALVEGEGAPAPVGVPLGAEYRGAVEAARPQPANGWVAAYGPPALPDRLKGEVELIQPGEDA